MTELLPFAAGDTPQAVEGTIERIVFQNPDTAWTVARVRSEQSGDLITVVGSLPGVAVGNAVRASGAFVSDPTYGEQFRVAGFVPLTPQTELGISRALGSGLVKGVGPRMAARIVETFGLRTLAVLEQTPERLREVPGLSRAKATEIARAWGQQRGAREALVLLQSHGLSPSLATRIHKTYGARTQELVRQNPYRLAQDVAGIGFRIADRIAQEFGVAPDAPQRAEAGLLHVLQEQSGRGHVCVPRDRLLAEAEAELLIPRSPLELGLVRLVSRGALVLEEAAGAVLCYPAPLHEAEVAAAQSVARRVSTIRATQLPTATAGGGVPLTEEQQEAVRLALAHRFAVITGGPGVGKTTLVRAIVHFVDPHGGRAHLAAPTGRAAKRLTEATGRSAQTLHRLLEFNPQEGRFARGPEKPLETELVVVDEASMLDLPLFAALLAALPPEARLLLVGDVDQLPAVGPGAVLADLLSVARVPAARLLHIHRQAAQSRIVQAAHRVNAGQMPEWDSSDRDSDFHFLEREVPTDLVRSICDLVADRIPNGLGIPPSDIQVLAPRHRGEAGTQALNLALQARLNPDGAPLGGPAGLRVGDKVMQLRNDYEKEVFNGDVGRVLSASPEGLTVSFEGRPVGYERRETDALQLAYCCSVHKAQGSEYPAVVLALLPQHHPMLQRNLVYTALTRGRRLVVVVGSRRALAKAVKRGERAFRHGLLGQRLRDQLEPSQASGQAPG